jgi:hypothetical protein
MVFVMPAQCPVILALFLFMASHTLACRCAGVDSVCSAFLRADAIFVGRVLATEPDLDPPDPEYRERAEALMQDPEFMHAEFKSELPPETLAKFKAYYAPLFSGPIRSAISNASSASELAAIVKKAFKRIRFTFRVYQSYKGLPASQSTIDVW